MTKVLFKKKKKIAEKDIIRQLQAKYDSIDETKITKFSQLPLSNNTLKGLTENEFNTMTDIQRQSIGLALKGNDIFGAAKTGSGKTLAFVVPILEILYRNQWTYLDGLGALIITPTRELAYQICEVIRKVGKYHNFTIGLIIGGQNLDHEKKKMHKCNIMIATPGRLLQHMDQNSLFDCITMKVLVLDEADRCLENTFAHTINAIIENLPPERQILLFSATQKKSVDDLARLSLKDPLYVSVHEYAASATPDGLQQSYIVCELEEKLAVLWSFIRNHLKQKIIVFFSSCKQVKFINEVFCRLRPGTSLIGLNGKMSQFRRLNIYETFCKKRHAVLFATDIASRGLDFPAVDWVVQMDCPPDVDTYIHRSGRTARFEKTGESLLIITPHEELMIERLKAKKIPINRIRINPAKLQSPHRKLEALLARDVALKESAQRAFVAYVKSVFLTGDKSIFNVRNIDTEGFARSLGLALPPRIRFLQRMEKNSNQADKNKKPAAKDKIDSKEDNEEESEFSEEKCANESFNKKQNFSFNDVHDDDDDDDDDILTIKRKHVEIDLPEEIEDSNDTLSNSKQKKAVTKAALAKKILKKKIIPNKKINFDEEGQEIIDPTKSKVSELAREYENEDASGINVMLAKKIMLEEDVFDKERYKEKLKQRRWEKKQKLKEKEKGSDKGPQVKEYDESESNYSDNGDESGDSYEPDVSYLPDPDKIYGKTRGSDEERNSDEEQSSNEEQNSDSDESESEDEQIHRPSKRKFITQDEHRGKKKKKLSSTSDNDNLQADEELALQLLRK